MKYVWNDKVDNTADGNVELVHDEKYNTFRLYVDKACYVLVNQSLPFLVADSLVLKSSELSRESIYSVLLHDKNVNYYYEGMIK